MNFCIIGSSKRHDVLCRSLSDKEFSCFRIERFEDMPQKIDADYIIFPIPTIKAGKLNLLGSPDCFTPEDVLKSANSDTVAISCNYSVKSNKGYDIVNREDFAYLNAIPTAEGAIKIAIENTERSITAQKILITGFGRVGKILADKLRGLGCDVTVSARSLKDRYYAKALGLKSQNIYELKNNICEFDIIFQTIPAKILNSNYLECMNNESIIIELSSGMIGTDLPKAKELKISVIDATGLPEKIAPITAGKIWAETIYSIIAEERDEDE